MRIKKRIISVLTVAFSAMMLTACGSKTTGKIKYHFADRKEAVECYLANDEYLSGFSKCELQYKLNNKNGTIEELKEYGASQMLEYSDEEKEAIKKLIQDMETDLAKNKYTLPPTDEIVLIKSTQNEEGGSGAYTHKTHIYFGDYWIEGLTSDDPEEKMWAKQTMWHELFHCLTRNNPDFRKKMYSIIHFTINDKDFEIPPAVYEKYISNPDVEHHNSYASFNINGEMKDCYTALIALKPYENVDDNFFDCMGTALVPIDGSNTFYLPEDASNFWDVFGENTEYVIDPEECMAENFSYAMTYGLDGVEYKNPEIIEAILEIVSN